MILGIIVTIFSLLGIYGFFAGNFVLLYIGMTLAIIEHMIGICSGQQKSLNTVWFALLIAFGMIFSGVNWLNAIAICLCFESSICFFLGLILLLTSNRFIKEKTKQEQEEILLLNFANDLAKKRGYSDYSSFEKIAFSQLNIDYGSLIDMNLIEKINLLTKSYGYDSFESMMTDFRSGNSTIIK